MSLTTVTKDTALDLKAHLAGRIRAALAGRTDRPLSWWWVPGRIEVFGKHTDYGGGPSLIGALPRGFLIAGAPREDQHVRVIDAGDLSTFDLDLATGQTAPGEVVGWRRYVNVLARRLARDFPGSATGADLALASDLPRASGMSSSSALVVGMAHALSRLGGLETRADWQALLSTPVDRGGYFGCLENGLPFGPLAGDGGVGTFGGSEDQTAIVCSRPEHLSAYTYVPVRHVGDVRVPDDWTFVLASSGVAAEKAGRAQRQYNRASLGVRRLTDLWRAEIGPVASLREVLVADPGPDGTERRLRLAIDRLSDPEWPREGLHVRLTHFAREYARVSAALAAFAAGDADAVGRLSAESHDEASALLGNQIAETNGLVALARRHGAFAASAFGAGFGGSVWALVPTADPAAVEAFGARWLAAYAADFPVRATQAAWFAARPGAPLTDL